MIIFIMNIKITRHTDDKILEHKTQYTILDLNISLGKKTSVLVTTYVMKTKRYFGMELI